jgi:excisionase family DNA binding protein
MIPEIDVETNRRMEHFEPLYTAQEVAGLLKTTTSNVYVLMKNGQMSHIRFGRLVRVRQSDLEKFISSHVV